MTNSSIWVKIGSRIVPLIYLVFPIINIFNYNIDRPFLEYILVVIIFTIDYVCIIFYYNRLNEEMLYALFIVHYILIDYFVFCNQPMNSLFYFFSAFAIPFMLGKGFKSKFFMTFVVSMMITIILTLVIDRDAVTPLIIYFVVILLMCVGNIYSLEERKLREKLTEQNKYINILIAEQERSRIGQDLHDTLGHVFASLTLKSELALKLIDQQPETAKKEIESINELSQDTLKKVRNIIENLQTLSFQEEVNNVSSILKDTEIHFSFSNIQLAESLNLPKQSLLSMVLKEAINNVIKYSKASEVNINLRNHDGGIILSIHDNGIGIKDVDIDQLHSIKSRVAYLNGKLNVYNKKGTELEIYVPRGEIE